MAMAAPAQTIAGNDLLLWDAILRQTNSALTNNTDPNVWASQITSILRSSAVTLPSLDLAHRLVSHLFWNHHSPAAWKLLNTAAELNLLPPLLLLALLSIRVVPIRKVNPIAYRLYLGLVKEYMLKLEFPNTSPKYEMIMESIDDVLRLSQVYSHNVCEPGVVLVEFVFSILWQLLEATLDDEGLIDHVPKNKPRWLSISHDMDIDEHDCINEMKTEQQVGLQRTNTSIAFEIIEEFLKNRRTSRLLALVHRNMPSYWGSFDRQMQLLISKSSILKNLKHISKDTLLSLMDNIHGAVSHEHMTKFKHESNVVKPAGSHIAFAGQCYGSSLSSLWLPIDLILEDALDGGHVAAFSAIEIITGLVKNLHAVNGTMWHNTFLGLWIAALRLVQRERDLNEGPVSRLDTCMCMLLSITTNVVANIIEEEESELIEEAECGPTNQGKNKQVLGKRREELITSLRLLGDFQWLLTPPQAVLMEANQAAAKAIMLVSGNPVGSGHSKSSSTDLPMNCFGNLRHLIVEACIARNILDTSAYSWPGYANACSNQIPSSISNHVDGWSSLMKGSQLTPRLVDVLATTPASSLAEIEKIYEIAIDGSDEEKISAATILCGASLVRGWNIQEHTIIFITKLLSPLPNHTETENHLISQAPFLNVLLVGISSIDCVHVFSLHGLVPLLATGLMRICEIFGSCVPDVSWTVTTGGKLSPHEVFSNAFTLLLRFWRFDHLPIEQLRANVATPPLGSLFSPENLLLVRNGKVASFGRSAKDNLKLKRLSKIVRFPREPVFMDSFPKLNSWHRQHQERIASIHSGLVPGGPAHQIVDALLSMMFRKVNNGSEPLSSPSSSRSGSALDDALVKLKVPAWDILEAVPFVLDASLNACACGRVSTRELATGLKDLADFIPASLVAIASYFSAEVTRGIWKPAFMNGTDWPSPAANLSFVEQQIKKILAATGVDVPSLVVDEDSPATLPLPLAAFASLSITYKLDNKGKGRFLVLIGPTLTAVASGCPWPCMPILTSLWIQKVRRWSDYFLLRASGTVFHHNKGAVVQLLKSCFASTLGHGSTSMNNNGGVGALLGNGLASQVSGGISPVAPGILYLRVYRFIGDIMFLNKEIMSILLLSVRDIARSELPKGNVKKQLSQIKYGMKGGQVSLVRYMERVKHAASLGASLVWISGGQKLVQSLIRGTVPSWFLSTDTLEQDDGESGVVVAMLSGYALAHFVMLSVAFAWGIDHYSVPPNRRAKVIALHLEFIVNTMENLTSPSCHRATWQAYVSGFVSLIVGCTPMWVREVDVELLKRLSKGLRQMNEDELALRLLEIGGIGAMGSAAEMIIECERM